MRMCERPRSRQINLVQKYLKVYLLCALAQKQPKTMKDSHEKLHKKRLQNEREMKIENRSEYGQTICMCVGQ